MFGQDKKEINLYSAYLRKKKSVDSFDATEKVRIISVSTVAVCLLAMAGNSWYLLYRKAELTKQLESVICEEASAEIAEGKRRHEILVGENDTLTEKNNLLSEQLTPITVEKQYSAFDSDLFLRIQGLCRNVIVLTDITTVDYELTLEFSADDAAEISLFVERLRAQELFSELQYSGYAENGDVFDFTLLCRLSEDGGGAANG